MEARNKARVEGKGGWPRLLLPSWRSGLICIADVRIPLYSTALHVRTMYYREVGCSRRGNEGEGSSAAGYVPN